MPASPGPRGFNSSWRTTSSSSPTLSTASSRYPSYKLVTADRLAAYEKNLHDQSGRIRKTEAENLKVARRRKRGERNVLRPVGCVPSDWKLVDDELALTRHPADLQSFRAALAELQRQVDELDAIKAAYHEEVLEGEDEVSQEQNSNCVFS
jgi:hypothetical protein